MMLTTAKPAPIELAPRAIAFGAINKFRCDFSETTRATHIEVMPPAEATVLSTPLRADQPVIDYCPAYPETPASNTVDIAPLVAAVPILLRTVSG